MSRNRRGGIAASEDDDRRTEQTSDQDEDESLHALVKWDELVPWQRDNEFIRTGYRKASNSYQVSVRSIWQVHNETVNIWTHLIGALGYCFIPFGLYRTLTASYPQAPVGDVLMLVIFFLGVTFCFSFSTFHHAFMNVNKEVSQYGLQLDHLGIVLVIWASMVPTDYFGFYCSPGLQWTYITIATVSGFGCAVFTMQPKFRTPAFRTSRSAMFGILGLSAFVPVVHSITLNGWKLQNERMSIIYFFGLGILNGTGTAIYAARIPERWRPGLFDIYGASHQIMHVLVAMGAFSQATGLVKALGYWHSLREKGEFCR